MLLKKNYQTNMKTINIKMFDARGGLFKILMFKKKISMNWLQSKCYAFQKF